MKKFNVSAFLLVCILLLASCQQTPAEKAEMPQQETYKLETKGIEKIQVRLATQDPSYGTKGKIITDDEEIKAFIRCFDDAKKEEQIDQEQEAMSSFFFQGKEGFTKEFLFKGKDDSWLLNGTTYEKVIYSGEAPFSLYEKSKAEEIIFYESEALEKAVTMSKEYVKDSEKNRIIDYLQPRVERQKIETSHKIFNLDMKEFVDLKGREVVKISYKTEDDDLLGPISFYVDAKSMEALGFGVRK